MAAAPGVVQRGLTTLLGGIVALTGCTGGRAAPQSDVPRARVDVPMTPIEMPAELRAGAPASWGWSLVARDGSEPPAAVGVVERPGEAAADREHWSWTPVPGRGGRNTVTLHTVADGVVVTYSGATADQAWLVGDPGAVIQAAGRGRG